MLSGKELARIDSYRKAISTDTGHLTLDLVSHGKAVANEAQECNTSIGVPRHVLDPLGVVMTTACQPYMILLAHVHALRVPKLEKYLEAEARACLELMCRPYFNSLMLNEQIRTNTTRMELPFDVLDHTFSFLKSHPKALLACSKAHPVFSQIVERYRFHHIIILTGVTEFAYSFKPSDLFMRIAETPHIVKYVAVLQVEFNYYQYEGEDRMTHYLDEIARLLPLFPVLECIMLRSSSVSWQKDLPQTFKTAVENCLQLQTLQEVHIGNISFPLSILDNHANINYLSLSGPPGIEPGCPETIYPQIKFLALEGFDHGYSDVFLTWAKRHIVGLLSLKYDFSCHGMIFEVLGICSDTLENLYLCLHREGTPCQLSSHFT